MMKSNAGAQHLPVDGLRQARDRAEDAAAAVSKTAKGLTADERLPQRYRLKALTPELGRKRTTNALILDTTRGPVKTATDKPRGEWIEWIVRSDGPHRGAPSAHININPDVSGLDDPHAPSQ